MTYLSVIDNQLKDKIDQLVKGHNLDRPLLDDDIEQQYQSIPNKKLNINAYLTNYINCLDLTKYVKKRKVINTLSLDLAFEKFGFTGTDEEKILISLIEEHCVNEFPVSVNQVIDLNHKVIEYMVKKGQKDYQTFISLILKSKTLRICNIPVDQLREQAKKIIDEWERILEILEPAQDEEKRIEQEIEEVYKDGTIN